MGEMVNSEATSERLATGLSPSESDAPSALDRSPAGRLLPGHAVTTKHGLDSERVPERYLAAAAALFDASVSDEGGSIEIPARRLAQLEYRALIHRQVMQLTDALNDKGLCDRRGKLRSTWLQRLEGLIATAIRIDTLLGLKRKPRNVSLGAYIQENYARGDK